MHESQKPLPHHREKRSQRIVERARWLGVLSLQDAAAGAPAL